LSGCCTPKGYRQIFSERSARAQARSYRRSGLDATSRRIVELLKEQRLEGLTLLEVGGGIGAIQIELLKAGVARAVRIELTPTYEESASELLREAGFEDRVERRVMDFVESGADVGAADIVIMNRVICCYPDVPRLAGQAADHTKGLLVMSFPKERWWTRAVVWMANFGMAVTRREFRIFLHPVAQILATTESHGLKRSVNRPGLFWQISAMRRTTS
jgi:2-polyprenyl-3-methyl-5-hydroxy-6-metoxy-1,4-benzoquinol methylase